MPLASAHGLDIVENQITFHDQIIQIIWQLKIGVHKHLPSSTGSGQPQGCQKRTSVLRHVDFAVECSTKMAPIILGM